MSQEKRPPIGAVVKVTYDISEPGPKCGDETQVKFEVDEHTLAGFVGGAGIGTKYELHTDQLLAPTSSDGYHADGDSRVRVGINGSWEVVNES